jgi:hypothetical protein
MLHLVLIVVVFALPVVGFVATLVQARSATSIAEARWIKRHGVLFWVVCPAFLGTGVVLGILEVLPRLVALMSTLGLGVTASLGLHLKNKRES